MEESKVVLPEKQRLMGSHERENSSCKNTVKMADHKDHKDFSFIDSHRESNVPLNYCSLLGKRTLDGQAGKPDQGPSAGFGSVNDTVSRVQGISSV